MSRARYQRVSGVDRQRIVDAFAMAPTILPAQPSSVLEGGGGAAYSNIRRSQITGTAAATAHAGGRPTKIDEEMRNFRVLLNEEMRSITFSEINRLMR